ncbi:MAG: PIG-L family deacetylase [Candidatus Krumholzibacteria bacterium]|nr:PIG-L family deacetylase [Candidatus Krumholzibacteria bacterium]MDH4335643.1 PIG-L family deacetylase [Candidatus Krumholzibacteria bacterium]MDH5270462.1 PIG-L family deacetylase [Candidatus Krumholzibacteria bacterium]
MRIALRQAVLTLFIVAAGATASAASDGPPAVLDAATLHLAMEKLTVVGSVLYVAAHPDDENTAMLTWLENEKLVRAGYLSMTRGDGGQNLIGDEQGDLLGVIRTEELLAARRIDGAEQFFTRAVDFGYSKGPDETLATWGYDAVLGDVVRVIRTFRPDVIVMRFPTTGEGRHGHHTASALLAVEAFEAAGDPSRFPDQLRTLSLWKPKRIVWNYFSWAAPPTGDSARQLLKIDLGAYNPLLGRSYTELAGESRSMHKSQGFGSPERRGTSINYFQVIAGEPAATDLFEGVDLSWKRIRGGDAVGKLLDEVHRAHDPSNPAASVPGLLRARAALAKLRASASAGDAPLLIYKARELDGVIRACCGLWLEAVAHQHTLCPGDSIQVDVTAINRSSAALRLAGVRSEPAGLDSPADSLLAENRPVTVALQSVVPASLDWRTTQPYWLRQPIKGGLQQVADPALIGTPWNDPALQVTVSVTVSGQSIDYTLPVLVRWVDRVRGELYRPICIAPEVTLALDKHVYLFPDGSARPIHLRLESRAALRGQARLALPSGWRCDPVAQEVDLPAGQTRDVVFQVTPGSEASVLAAEFTTGDHTFTRGMTVIDYPHIPIVTVFPPATAHVVRLPLSKVGETIGYIMGPGDDVPAALAQAGYGVTLIEDAELASGDLSGYDAIVTGVRAYNTREALKRNSHRLLDYVASGGTLVVQYNTADRTLYRDFAPFPLEIGRDRVTVEEAPVDFADPASPLLATPNRITAQDFEGWVQERGLYFASTWGPEYHTALSSADPGEKPAAGGLVWARHGKGIFIYTGYSFFRQLPAGVPGAYRLFINLVSARG